MGFIVTGSTFNTTQGQYDSLYGRIESYSYNRHDSTLYISTVLFTPNENTNNTRKYPIDFDKQSNVIGVSLEKDGVEIEYPFAMFAPLTSSVVVDAPIYTNHITSQSISYYDFDENGDVVEKKNWEYTSHSIITGMESVEQDIANSEILTGNIFPFMYNLVTGKFKEIFGEENIINV